MEESKSLVFNEIYPKILKLIQHPFESGESGLGADYEGEMNNRKVSCSEAVELLESTIEKIKNTVPLDFMEANDNTNHLNYYLTHIDENGHYAMEKKTAK